MDTYGRLKKYRIQKGDSQQKIAKLLGCTVSAYSKYENGDREPSVTVLITLADYYGITLDQLVGHIPVIERQTADEDSPNLSEMAKLKKNFDYTEAEKLNNVIILSQLKSLEEFRDCLSVQDIYRKIDYLLTITGCETKGLVKAFGVSRSGYYHWKEYGDVVRKRNSRIADLIMRYEIPAADSAGYRAVMEYLRSIPGDPELQTISLHRVKYIMDEFEIIPEDIRSQKDEIIFKFIGKYPASSLPTAENTLRRNFNYEVPPCKCWCIDITEIHTDEGKLYLCGVIDLCGRYLIGYSIGKKMNFRLIRCALDQARDNAKKYNAWDGEPTMLHSDRATQFRSSQMDEYRARYGIEASMSKANTPNDNACIESFFASLKCEYLYRYHLDTSETAKELIKRYILYYNTIRVHETIKEVPFVYWSKKIK